MQIRWTIPPAHSRGQMREEHLLRNIDDPNEVILLFEAKGLQKAKGFGASDLRKAMQNAGVIDKPAIYFLDLEPSIREIEKEA
jgi:hypothetical protein